MTIDQMCIEANRNLIAHINRSVGQHLRHMREKYAPSPTEDDIFAIAMESDTAYKLTPWLCKQAGIDYPPRQARRAA